MRGAAAKVNGSNPARVYYEVRQKNYSLKINEVDVNCYNHVHEDVEILYMRSGTQHITVDGKAYAVNQREAAVIFPNSVHSYFRGPQPKAADAVLIICSSKFYNAFLPDLTGLSADNPIITKEHISDEVRYAFEAIDKTGNDNVRTAWTVIIMTGIIEKMEIIRRERFPTEELCCKIIKYIENNFTRDISLNTIAKELSVSRSYVTRIFSEKIKMNFRRYLGACRAEYAAALIRTTPDSLTAISENAGFESQSTFNRTFKDIYGMTPREFRSNIQRYSKTV